MCINYTADKVVRTIRDISDKTSEVYSAWVLKVHFATIMYRKTYNYNPSSLRLTDNNQRRGGQVRRSNDPSSAS